MPSRYDRYRMKDGLTRLGEAYFNAIWRDLDVRLASLEDLRIAWTEAVRMITETGLVRINEILAPAFADVSDKSAQVEAMRVAALDLIALLEDRIANTGADLDAWLAAREASQDQWQQQIVAVQAVAIAGIDTWKSQQLNALADWRAALQAEQGAAIDDIEAWKTQQIDVLDGWMAALTDFSITDQRYTTKAEFGGLEATVATAQARTILAGDYAPLLHLLFDPYTPDATLTNYLGTDEGAQALEQLLANRVALHLVLTSAGGAAAVARNASLGSAVRNSPQALYMALLTPTVMNAVTGSAAWMTAMAGDADILAKLFGDYSIRPVLFDSAVAEKALRDSAVARAFLSSIASTYSASFRADQFAQITTKRCLVIEVNTGFSATMGNRQARYFRHFQDGIISETLSVHTMSSSNSYWPACAVRMCAGFELMSASGYTSNVTRTVKYIPMEL
ncbi:hypothetical protein [Stutzerimonas kunmingensis]|uniref:hypothetical protein n=1 Tax=Stutzerimonas kunmingensis TaxID=1211807 RepID=UPI0028A91798|nr:hypothetical protein [Stutzerimonas kunmingensis]